MQQHQADRFARLIDQSNSFEDLRRVLNEAFNARLPEESFSGLYALAVKRAQVLRDIDKDARGAG